MLAVAVAPRTLLIPSVCRPLRQSRPGARGLSVCVIYVLLDHSASINVRRTTYGFWLCTYVLLEVLYQSCFLFFFGFGDDLSGNYEIK